MVTSLLGLDPGFASLGFAVVTLKDSGPHLVANIVAMGVIRTEKSSKKQKVLASDDNFRRAKEISRELRLLTEKHSVSCICAESMSFPRNSSSAAKMAMSWGVIADICEQTNTPMLMATPKEIKKKVCSNGSASKEEIQAALNSRFESVPLALLELAGVPSSQHEHPFDALAAILACLDSEIVRLLIKSGKHSSKMGEVGYDPGSSVG